MKRKRLNFLNLIVIFFISIIILGFTAESSSFLASTIFGSEASTSSKYDLTIDKVIGIITGLACWATRFALLILVGAMFIYALQILASRGDQVKYAAGKKSFGLAIVGALVILGLYMIIATVAYSVGGPSTFTPLSCPKL